MSNMSYCRFQNTNKDLYDCVTALEEMNNPGDDLSNEEYTALRSMFRNCQAIIDMFDGELPQRRKHD